MRFAFIVRAELERESGKFASKDELGDEIREVVEGADPQSLYGGPDGDSEYTVVEWDVEDLVELTPAAYKRLGKILAKAGVARTDPVWELVPAPHRPAASLEGVEA